MGESQTRKWAIRIGCVLVLGLLLNIGVAWLTAMALPSRGPLSYLASPTDDRGYTESVPASFGEPDYVFKFPRLHATYWQVLWEGPDENAMNDDAIAHVWRHGFPFLALEGRTWAVSPQSQLEPKGIQQFGTIPMPRWHTRLMMDRTPNTQYTNLLPLLPIWPGMIANTLFYATPCLLIWLRLARSRRTRRIRKGLCPSCAYDLAGFEECPECGCITPTAS